MRKFMIALSVAVLGLAGIGMGLGVAQTATQIAGVESDYRTSAEEDKLHMRDIADADVNDINDVNEINDRYINSPEHDGDDYQRQIADVEYDYPRPEHDGDDSFTRRVPGDSRA